MISGIGRTSARIWNAFSCSASLVDSLCMLSAKSVWLLNPLDSWQFSWRQCSGFHNFSGIVETDRHVEWSKFFVVLCYSVLDAYSAAGTKQVYCWILVKPWFSCGRAEMFSKPAISSFERHPFSSQFVDVFRSEWIWLFWSKSGCMEVELEWHQSVLLKPRLTWTKCEAPSRQYTSTNHSCSSSPFPRSLIPVVNLKYFKILFQILSWLFKLIVLQLWFMLINYILLNAQFTVQM